MGIIIGANINQSFTSLTQGNTHGLGDRAEGAQGQEYIFCQAGSAVAAFDTCIIGTLSNGPDFQAFPVTTTNVAAAPVGGKIMGIAQAAAASAEYFWACIYGKTKLTVLTAALPNVPLYTTATAGALDDTIVTAGIINGLRLESTASGTTSITAFASWPTHVVNVDSA